MPAAVEMEHLFTLFAKIGRLSATAGGPQGGRLIVDASSGTFEGERLRGTVLPPGGDWVTQRDDGKSVKLDVRLVLKTDDGATILMTYMGIGLPRDDGNLDIRTAPLFETGDERYAWLNRVQAIGVGASESGGVRYEVYALK